VLTRARTLIPLTLAVILLALFAGAGQAAAGVTNESVTVNGVTRTYRLYTPSTLPAKVPVLIALHTLGINGSTFALWTGFDSVASSKRFLAVYPNGIGNSWNAGRCCSSGSNPPNDVAFIKSILAKLGGRFTLDTKRIYATGHSNGAMMAYRLACERAGTFAGIGVVAGTLVTSPCSPSRPVSVMHIHGLADTTVPYNGTSTFPSVPSVISFWKTVDGCTSSSTSTSGTRTRLSWRGCSAGSGVVLNTIAGMTHTTWPRSLSFNATRKIWNFLAAHPRP
jgi:polyhydroxybutyrate depolymerase